MKKGICALCQGAAIFGKLMCSDCLRSFDFAEYDGEIDEATYDPDDDKLRLYSDFVPKPLYAALSTLGFQRAPKQGCFFGVWSPKREDVALIFCEEIIDEDSTLMDRAAERSVRFATYESNAKRRAVAARQASDEIAQYIPPGQPVLVGHHSEKRHRRDIKRMRRYAAKQVEEFDRQAYWKTRADASLRHAERKYAPRTVSNRVKRLEAEHRKYSRELVKAQANLSLWCDSDLSLSDAMKIANHDSISVCFTLEKYPRDRDLYEGPKSLWAGLSDGIINAEQAREIAIPIHWRTIEDCTRWIEHLAFRIEYWKAFLIVEHGENIDSQREIKKGQWVVAIFWGRANCAQVVRVNRSRDIRRITTISIDRETEMGRPHYTRKWNYDDVVAVLDEAPTNEKLFSFLPEATPVPAKTEDPLVAERAVAVELQQQASQITVLIGDPDLYPTPHPLAERMVDLADVQPTLNIPKLRFLSILEPSAGDGRIADLLKTKSGQANGYAAVNCCEINENARSVLLGKGHNLVAHDFLTYDPGPVYDRVVMNPPFSGFQDSKHVLHAWSLLRPGGKLVAIVSSGALIRNYASDIKLRHIVRECGWSELLPSGTFEDTAVKTYLIVMEKPL